MYLTIYETKQEFQRIEMPICSNNPILCFILYCTYFGGKSAAKIFGVKFENVFALFEIYFTSLCNLIVVVVCAFFACCTMLNQIHCVPTLHIAAHSTRPVSFVSMTTAVSKRRLWHSVACIFTLLYAAHHH